MIWRKPNALPQNHNRYEPEFEYMFVFSKGKPKTFDGIRVPCLGAGSEEDWGRRADGEQVGEIGDVYARRARDDAEPRTTKADKLHGNVFEYPVGGNGPGRTWRHPAPFPYALARDHIVTWSREGDAVLDCFCGSGTTLEAARNLNRSFVGIELSERYAKMSAKRVGCEAIDVPSADIS